MTYNFDKSVKKALANVSDRNPIRSLSDNDKRLLVSLLVLYDRKPVASGFCDQLEKVESIAADAKILAERIESNVLNGALAEALGLSISPTALLRFRLLPKMLTEFSTAIGGLLHSLGKPGHKEKMLRNHLLVLASEFVRVKTGKHYDEHLAEFFQAATGEHRGLESDVSGDAIRKKREHIRKAYPQMYTWVQNSARDFAKTGST